MVAGNECRFYTICDAGYFPGLAGLLNSLRLTGHRAELVVLDNGLTPEQRPRLRPHCTLVDRPPECDVHPQLFKPWPALLKPTGTVVVIDSDIIVTRSLDPLLRLAQQGKICAFPDPQTARWFGEWEQLFHLSGPLRRQTYVNSGFIAFSTRHWPDLLERWWQACRHIWSHPTVAEGAADSPSSQADQDALNALLMSEVPAEALVVPPIEEAPASRALRWKEVQVVDARGLACAHRGHPTTLLHAADRCKPWRHGGWREVRRQAYTRLLQRLLLDDDVPIKLAPTELPIWLRRGPLGELSIRGLDFVNDPHVIRRTDRLRRLVSQAISPRTKAMQLGTTGPGDERGT